MGIESDRMSVAERLPWARPEVIAAIEEHERRRKGLGIVEVQQRNRTVALYLLTVAHEVRRRWARSIPYEAYLKTPYWRELREVVLQQRRGRCESCGQRERLQVHHKCYERLGFENLSDLEVLCADCHAAVHGLPPRDSIAAILVEVFRGPKGRRYRGDWEVPAPDPRDRGAWRLPADAGWVERPW